MYTRFILSLAIFGSIASAQSIIPDSQPACIQQCQVFVQAQQACSPDQGQQALYQSCFCQSAYLATIKTNAGNNLCQNCAAGDWTTIASWYNGFCGGGAAPAGGANTQTTLVTETTPAGGAGAAPTTATTPGSSGATAVAGGTLSSSDNPANWTDAQSWFKGHWQWVVMIIVLAVAFTAIGIIGTIIHKRKSRAKKYGINHTAPMTSTPAVNSWAPSRHSVHDFGTPREPSPAPPMPTISSANSRRQSRRLGKTPVP